MQTSEIDLPAFAAAHIEGALRLSRQAGWPHRLEDWRMALGLSQGVAAVEADGTVVGTILVTPYKTDCATINMVIVDEAMRGRGIGRILMDSALRIAGNRPLRLIATSEGLPLYEKLGFQVTGRIQQHQGKALPVVALGAVEIAGPSDLAAIGALDRIAFGADRGDLLADLANVGEFTVIRREGKVAGFAALRTFGRGEVIGPVVAANLEDAKTLISHFAAARTGRFLRVDTNADSGLSPWLAEIGLVHVGGGIAMAQPLPRQAAAAAVKTFALANQAFG
jgi:GNAT superfamily N-acetyltransferase